MTLLWYTLLALVWCVILDVGFIQPSRRLRAARAKCKYAAGALSLALRVSLGVYLAIGLCRVFVVDVYNVPSRSMLPTLAPSDLVFINRLAYGLRLPLTGDVLIGGATPKRGDIAFFKYPNEPSTVFVKRIVGLPGDVVAIEEGGVVRLSGRAVSGRARDGVSQLSFASSGASYPMLIGGESVKMVHAPVEVPAEHYFVLGQNLDESRDSREWGFVKASDMLGRALLLN